MKTTLAARSGKSAQRECSVYNRSFRFNELLDEGFPMMRLNSVVCAGAWMLLVICIAANATAQTLEQRLLGESPEELAAAARANGDAARGAIVFHQPYMACSKCHVHGKPTESLGPDLTMRHQDVNDVYLVDSLLRPSQVIRKGFESVTLITDDGKSIVGVVADESASAIVLRDATRPERRVTIPRDKIDESLVNKQSIMPAGQVNQLASRQQFLDLLRYVMEISEQGITRADQLQPPPSAYATRPLPAYEAEIDHAGIIRDLGKDNFERGEAIYNRLCINCHGTHDKVGSLPTSLRFASGKFKNGNDPFTMYQTLTRGFGMMIPQSWMVPQQKYDVIHYIREAYLKKHNSGQHFPLSDGYLANLPKGTTRGPEPSTVLPWEQMDYGHNLVATYEVGTDRSNFAFKGNAIRLDPGAGGVSQGRHWMIFDYDTLRLSAAWSGEGFIDWNGINFNGRHGIHPRVSGAVHVANPTGPGWANPIDGKFADTRLRGRDRQAYGPLAREWAHYKGMYYHGQKVVVEYTVGDSTVLEMPGVTIVDDVPVFTRTFNIGPRKQGLTLRVATEGDITPSLQPVGNSSTVVSFGTSSNAAENGTATSKRVVFDGATRVEVVEAGDLNMHSHDFTITARIKTTDGGTIFAKTKPDSVWVANGKTLFVRGGKLAFDIGWVGAVQSRKSVDDGRWHDVAATYSHKTGNVTLFVDGQANGQKRLKSREAVTDHVARIGFTSGNFPGPKSYFEGAIEHVRFYDRALSESELAEADSNQAVAAWSFDSVAENIVSDQSGNERHGQVIVGDKADQNAVTGPLVAGLAGEATGLAWSAGDEADLLLTIPAGEQPLRFTVWTARVNGDKGAEDFASQIIVDQAARDLSELTKGGPPRWPEQLKSQAIIGNDDGPFAVDVLTPPANNPWFCRMRLTGFDFFADGDRAAVSSWDGSVWLVSGLAKLPAQNENGEAIAELTWQRIASGLFQPLGVKIVDETIFVSCRDQICILRDLNGDNEIDRFENFNNDHQVTDHFHEFAMGLQRDADGNFYYAKSARHALTALVPHHGTLLRVSPDGSRTDIVANGFRAANGVCLNPDGTFIVTDQEGHWNPKNRINWVREGGFYGNMFGYHDVEDSSNEAMDQPLCWITNAFDRSPAELLWVDSPAWGRLNGSLLNLSYGYGKVYVVPHEEIDGQMQGGMCELPLPQFPTGTMRGRFNPADQQLYTCGMFAWGSNQQEQEGGFYRIRYTGKPATLPIGLKAKRDGLELGFTDQLDPKAATQASNYSIKVWNLKRTANYGSKHFDEREIEVAAAQLGSDGRTVFLNVPDIEPTWCMEIKYRLVNREGNAVTGVIHNTIHAVAD